LQPLPANTAAIGSCPQIDSQASIASLGDEADPAVTMSQLSEAFSWRSGALWDSFQFRRWWNSSASDGASGVPTLPSLTLNSRPVFGPLLLRTTAPCRPAWRHSSDLCLPRGRWRRLESALRRGTGSVCPHQHGGCPGKARRAGESTVLLREHSKDGQYLFRLRLWVCRSVEQFSPSEI
jgi:hypothetical protein